MLLKGKTSEIFDGRTKLSVVQSFINYSEDRKSYVHLFGRN